MNFEIQPESDEHYWQAVEDDEALLVENKIETNKIYQGDALEIMKSFPGNFVDSIITDPPAGIEFMGKEWDSFKDNVRSKGWAQQGKDGGDDFGGFGKKLRPAFCSQTNDDLQNFQDFICQVFSEAIRVIKPGGHALVWAIPRTSHHTAMGLERAGFEIRDCIIHMFGSGFPKSLNISKNIEKQAGIEMPIGKRFVVAGYENDKMIEPTPIGEERDKMRFHPTTDEGKQWEGWGTALKPACEFWWLARKPLEQNTIAENVLKWGTGGISINKCRVLNDKNNNFVDYVEQISSRVYNKVYENTLNKDCVHNVCDFYHNFGTLYSFLVGDSYLLAQNEELNVQNLNYQKLLNYLGGCSACFHQCDALVHLLLNLGLISFQQLNDVHKYISLFQQGLKPLHSHEKYNDLPSNCYFLNHSEVPTVQKNDCDGEFYIYQEYLRLLRENTHTCEKGKLNQIELPSNILDKSFFQCLYQTLSSDEFLPYIKYTIPLFINFTIPLLIDKLSEKGRFPSHLIHDGSPEVLEVFPNCKSSPFRSATTIGKRENTYNQDTFDYSGRGYSDLGSASRFFKQCPNDNVYICPLCYDAYAKEHNKEWRNTNANNVEKNLTITQVITENFVQWNALEEVKLKSAQIARYVGNLCEKCGMNFVQELVVIKDYQEGSQYQKELQVMQDFIGNYKKCILLQNLVNYVEIWDSIDTTQITKNLLTLFGSANHVITNYIQKIEKSAPKRFVYAPKASKDERNYGCEELEEKEWDFNTMGTQTPEAIRARGRNPENQNKPMKNNHPTVKALALMRYLCKLITPPNGIILDMFAGSGSTLIAARQENFNFIGIEKELDYINIAKARLKPYLEQSKLTIPIIKTENSSEEVMYVR